MVFFWYECDVRGHEEREGSLHHIVEYEGGDWSHDLVQQEHECLRIPEPEVEYTEYYDYKGRQIRADEELRLDPNDDEQRGFTKEEFIQYYGGTQEWEAASKWLPAHQWLAAAEAGAENSMQYSPNVKATARASFKEADVKVVRSPIAKRFLSGAKRSTASALRSAAGRVGLTGQAKPKREAMGLSYRPSSGDVGHLAV